MPADWPEFLRQTGDDQGVRVILFDDARIGARIKSADGRIDLGEQTTEIVAAA